MLPGERSGVHGRSRRCRRNRHCARRDLGGSTPRTPITFQFIPRMLRDELSYESALNEERILED